MRLGELQNSAPELRNYLYAFLDPVGAIIHKQPQSLSSFLLVDLKTPEALVGRLYHRYLLSMNRCFGS
jgi:hypothetical protein